MGCETPHVVSYGCGEGPCNPCLSLMSFQFQVFSFQWERGYEWEIYCQIGNLESGIPNTSSERGYHGHRCVGLRGYKEDETPDVVSYGCGEESRNGSF